MPTRLRRLLLAVATITAGCSESRPPDAPPAAPQRPAVVLRIAVYDDEQLARAIDRLRGESEERGRGKFETIRLESVADAEALCAGNDLVVFPSRWIGELCESERLRPIRQSVLDREELSFSDFFPSVRDAEIVYGNRVMALPIGCPTPLLIQSGAGPIDFPEGEVRLALSYLAWAAPHAVHRSRVATLFSAEDFRPRLTEPPYVRALEAFAAAAKSDSNSTAALVWPERDRVFDSQETELLVIRPPGVEESYNPIAGVWEPLEGSSQQATLIASSGRLLGVTATTHNAAAAFRLAAWLAGAEHGTRLSSSSNSVANCRGSTARRSDAWVAEPRGLGQAFAKQGAQALRDSRRLIAPRLPAADEYLAALGVQIGRHLAGEISTEDALKTAAAEWEAINKRLGLDQQRAAYLRSINAADYTPHSR